VPANRSRGQGGELGEYWKTEIWWRTPPAGGLFGCLVRTGRGEVLDMASRRVYILLFTLPLLSENEACQELARIHVHVFDENGQREALGEDKIANHNGVADATRE